MGPSQPVTKMVFSEQVEGGGVLAHQLGAPVAVVWYASWSGGALRLVAEQFLNQDSNATLGMSHRLPNRILGIWPRSHAS